MFFMQIDLSKWSSQVTGVNFIKAPGAAITHTNSKSAKKTVKLSVFFCALGSAHVKAAGKMFMELAPGLRNDFENQSKKENIKISLFA